MKTEYADKTGENEQEEYAEIGAGDFKYTILSERNYGYYHLVLKEEGITMRKIMKFTLGFVVAVFIIIVVFWGSIVYVTDYKITKVDTSVSPDGTYELVLQAVGEADFPFGSASGRLILYEGKNRISKADFELFDDGGCIRSSIWEVTWHEDCVKAILSGDEQLDEQIILYFDGRKEVKQGENVLN